MGGVVSKALSESFRRLSHEYSLLSFPLLSQVASSTCPLLTGCIWKREGEIVSATSSNLFVALGTDRIFKDLFPGTLPGTQLSLFLVAFSSCYAIQSPENSNILEVVMRDWFLGTFSAGHNSANWTDDLLTWQNSANWIDNLLTCLYAIATLLCGGMSRFPHGSQEGRKEHRLIWQNNTSLRVWQNLKTIGKPVLHEGWSLSCRGAPPTGCSLEGTARHTSSV